MKKKTFMALVAGDIIGAGAFITVGFYLPWPSLTILAGIIAGMFLMDCAYGVRTYIVLQRLQKQQQQMPISMSAN